MSILTGPSVIVGQEGEKPRIVQLSCNDAYATVVASNYLYNEVHQQGFSFSETDIVLVSYGTDPAAPSLGIFKPILTSTTITLEPMVNQGAVVLPTIANHIATYTGTTGILSEDAATAINGGNIQAGLNSTAGSLVSFPSATDKGSLKVTAVANTGNTVTTISNAAMGQASVVSIPDPATATANFVVAPSALVSGNLVKASGTAGLIIDAGAKIISGTTAAYGGGGTSNAFTVSGLTSAAVGAAVIRASTNAVSIAKALPGSNTLTITFSADPGASTTVDYIYTTAAQT